jgi:FKBP-type peptidyl-prolyl cis-trans isomerase SlyD
MSTSDNNQAMMIDDDCVVGMHYRLTNGFGELVDGSQGDLPLVYMHNTNALLPSLERELTGHRAGEALQITIYPEDGYGYSDESLIQDWPLEAVREQLPAEVPLIVGQRLKALGAEDASQLVTVTEVGEDTVRLDANHPLAGQVLHFEISIVAVREPSEAERAQGFATSVNP